MTEDQRWFQRHRTGLWHLRQGGVKQYRDWRQRQTADRSPQSKRRTKTVPSTVLSDLDVPVIAGLATMPSRVPLLKDAFRSIYWQVDEVYVFLNNFEDIPAFLQRPGVKIFRSQDYEDYKDVGKFFALRNVEQGILFTIDDDIVYPPDYVSKMLSHLANTGFTAAIGVHGFQLPRFPTSIFDRHFFHFQKSLTDAVLASVLGTGTTVFDIEQVGLKFSDFTSYGMADIHFAAHLKKMKIPALVVPRPAKWLKALSIEDQDAAEPTLFEQTQRDSAPHNTILRSLAPWGETDTLTRWQALPDDDILSAPMRYALNAIRLATLGETNIFSKFQKSPDLISFSDAQPWIDVYADISSRYRIYVDVLESKPDSQTRKAALDGLWKTDTSKAVEFSRRFAAEQPRNVHVLRQHAKFCAGYHLVDEAEEYYLRAIRLAGTTSEKATSSILFEYFKTLIRFQNYDKAAILGATLKYSHGKDPYFQAWMILVHLSEEDSRSAEALLTTLAASRHPRRQGAIATLVRALADGGSLPLADSVVSANAVSACSNSPQELVALLKIATVVADKSGAATIWETLKQDYPNHLDQHPELRWFYASNWNDASNPIEQHAMEALLSGAHETVFGENLQVLSKPGVHTTPEEEPLVSVILTAFNAEDTINFAVESILNQTHKNLELIIVDDKSTDNTATLAQAWIHTDPRVSVITNTYNLGPYVSRNVAIKQARGLYIAIQDADDISQPHRLEVQLASFTSTTKAVLGQHIRITRKGAVRLENDGSILGHGPVTLMVKREVITELGPFAEVRTRGDKEFESRLEHFYGIHALLRTPKLLVFALHDDNTNSRRETATSTKKRDLMLFKENYTRNHAEGQIKLQ